MFEILIIDKIFRENFIFWILFIFWGKNWVILIIVLKSINILDCIKKVYGMYKK